MSLLLGCIADDYTGATDLANNLVRAGMRVVQTLGVPDDAADDTDPGSGQAPQAIVVALKSRTIEPAQAIAQSLRALHWLRARGARQIYFKVCSTFDSTPRGNIGPVAEALLDELARERVPGTDLAVVTPAFPDNGRTVFKGHLFVGDVLLSESGMRDHPLTPMTDASLVRVMQAQSQRAVGLIAHEVVVQGPQAITARMDALRAQDVGLAIVDAVTNEDLFHLGAAVRDAPLMVAGSGLAMALPANAGIQPNAQASALPPPGGARAVISGSCSQATLGQVAHFVGQGGATRAVQPLALARNFDAEVAAALAWAAPHLGEQPVLLHATDAPQAVRAAQAELGVQQAGELVERALAAIAQGLVRAGVRQLVVAGGETSGAVVQALGLDRLQIGPQVDPGVPWCAGRSAWLASQNLAAGLHLALKSGNFGGPDFFVRAFGVLAVQAGRAPAIKA